MRSVYFVESDGFKELMHALEPGDTVPKRGTVMHVVNAKYSSTTGDKWCEKRMHSKKINCLLT